MHKTAKKKRSLTWEEQAYLPWFLTVSLRKRVQKLLPRYYYYRLRLYFAKYGCISCKRKNAQYWSNSLCRECYFTIAARFRRTDEKLQTQFNLDQQGAARTFLRRLESAKRLLGDLKAILH